MVRHTPEHDEYDDSLEKLKEMLEDIPEISDEEVLTNLLKQGSFEAISKFLLRKSLSFEILEELKTGDADIFLQKTIAAVSNKDLELIEGELSKNLTNAEQKEILKDKNFT